MSRENIEIVRRGFESFEATGRFLPGIAGADFVWDMSNFQGWPEQQLYEGPEETQAFLDEWTAAWEDWTLDAEEFLDAGEQVVVLVRQRGRSRTAGLVVEMHFAQVFTLREGKQTRMEMYSDPDQALKAVGLAE